MKTKLLISILLWVVPCLGSSYTWKSGVTGNWSDTNQWTLPGGITPASPPGSSDTVIISSGSVTVDTNFTVGTLNLSGGDLTRATNQTLTVSEVMNWTGGHLRGDGTLLIDTAAVFHFDNGAYAAFSGIIETAGLTVWSASADVVLSGTVVTNRAGATWIVQNNRTFDWDGGALGGSRFDNAGIFRKEVGTGTTTFDIYNVFNNYGLVDLQSGTVQCSGSFSHAGGIVTVGPGATFTLGAGGGATAPFINAGKLEWNGGTFTLSSGSSFSGLGTNRVSSTGTLTVNANVAMRNLELAGIPGSSVMDGTGTLTVSNRLVWTGGAMLGTGRTVVEAGGVLEMPNTSGITLQYRTLENGGLARWTGSAGFNLAGTISNRLWAVWEVRNNQTVANPGILGTARFDNAGTFHKLTGTAGAGTTTFASSAPFYNSGTVDLQTGTLQCSGGFSHAGGIVTVSPAATFTLGGGGGATAPFINAGKLEWNGGTFTLSSGSSFSGLGTNRVSSTGTLTVNANVAMRNLELAGTPGFSVIDGTNTLTVSNRLVWTGGTMQGTGRTVVEAGGTLQISNTISATVYQRTLENGGLAQWTGSAVLGLDGATVSNRVGAIWEVANNQTLYWGGGPGGPSRFDNAGIFRKVTGAAGAGTTTVNSAIALNNYGRVDLQSGTLQLDGQYTQYDGLTSVCGGNINNSLALAITGGSLIGSNNISGTVNFTSSGVCEPGCSPGRLTIGGDYSQPAGTTLNIQIAGTEPGVSFDQLSVGGTATLGGTLRVSLVNGFNPVSNATFTILTAGARSGTFANLIYPSNQVVMALSNTPTAVILRIVSVIPDLTPPVLTCPGEIRRLTPDQQGLVVTYSATATDDRDPPPVVSCQPPSGSLFPVGTTAVTCTARDASSNITSCTFNVVVTELQASQTSGGLALNWEVANAILEAAEKISGPWVTVPYASSPLTVPLNDPSQFYRLRYINGPRLLRVEPSTISADNASGTDIYLFGLNLGSNSLVRVKGQLLTDLTVVESNVLRGTVGSLPDGTYDVEVVDAGGAVLAVLQGGLQAASTPALRIEAPPGQGGAGVFDGTAYELGIAFGPSGSSVQLASGEVMHDAVDLVIPPGLDLLRIPPGLDLIWSRTYRSRLGENTAQGNGWTHSYDMRIEQQGSNLVLHANGHADVYRLRGDGTYACDGSSSVLVREADGSFKLAVVSPEKGSFIGTTDNNALDLAGNPFGQEASVSYGKLEDLLIVAGNPAERVASSLFTTTLDFGPDVAPSGPGDSFGGHKNDYWLEVALAPTSRTGESLLGASTGLDPFLGSRASRTGGLPINRLRTIWQAGVSPHPQLVGSLIGDNGDLNLVPSPRTFKGLTDGVIWQLRDLFRPPGGARTGGRIFDEIEDLED